jgi:hypothetical protein
MIDETDTKMVDWRGGFALTTTIENEVGKGATFRANRLGSVFRNTRLLAQDMESLRRHARRGGQQLTKGTGGGGVP